MAFGIIHYAFLVDAIGIGICMLLLLNRYREQRNMLTLVFVLFLLTLTLQASLYFIRGLWSASAAEDILAFRFIQANHIFIAILLIVFLLYPQIKQKEGTLEAKRLQIFLIVVIIVGVIGMILPFISEISWTYDDLYGLPHYTLASAIPFTYQIILAIDAVYAIIAAIFLIQMIRIETESFYKTKATLLLVGWLIIVFAQFLLLSSALSLLTPVLSLVGMLLMAFSILRQPPS
ncbi:hypothetical protein EU545_03770 [Candidatus Thorarchaeota archaeon]|nr:MAG: hypothetical protein EU545_03770 [Candidatus Thorarchaeota archaeon]